MSIVPDGSGASRSLWMLTAKPPMIESLTGDLHVDVCVVGAGIAGMTTAYLLAREGREVVVLDDGPIGGGETGRTTAHLTCVLDAPFHEIERLHGPCGLALALESHVAAIDRIEQIVAETGADCGFQRLNAYRFVPPGDPVDVLEREFVAGRRARLPGLSFVERAPMTDFDTGRCLRFTRQAQFHPLDYLYAIANGLQGRRARCYTGAHVDEVEPGAHPTVHVASGPRITARAVVIATNAPIHSRVRYALKQAAYRTYVIGARVPSRTVTPALYYDTLSPYHYVRLQNLPAHLGGPESELLIVGGEDHKTGRDEHPEHRWRELERWARERFGSMQDVILSWSGQVMEPSDALAYIGRDPEDAGIYVATGDAGMGMTHGTIAGMLLTDLIQGRPNPWAELYDPGRVRGAAKLVRENADTALQYKDVVTGGEVDSADEILRGQGGVLRRGMHKIAAYREPDGTLHEMSAVCTHMGCIVAWNSAESTWDCPCHGSRYDARGDVVNGPAVMPLGSVHEAKNGRR